MGYSYDRNGRLCCDICDSSGGVRKYRCPFGYCHAIALCPKCKSEHPEYVSKEFHRKHGCDARQKELARFQQERISMQASGKFIRTSALLHPKRPQPNIKVIFSGANGECQGYWMTDKTYYSIPIGELNNPTPDDYCKFGKVIKAKNENIYDMEMVV